MADETKLVMKIAAVKPPPVIAARSRFRWSTRCEAAGAESSQFRTVRNIHNTNLLHGRRSSAFNYLNEYFLLLIVFSTAAYFLADSLSK